MSPSRRTARRALPPFSALCTCSALVFAGCGSDGGSAIDDSGSPSHDSGDATEHDAADTAIMPPPADSTPETDASDAGDASTADGDEVADATDGDATDGDETDGADAGDAADAADTNLGCGAPSDCPGVDTDCFKRTCDAGKCGTQFTAAGTAASTQTAGDCKKMVCDGTGNVIPVNDDGDLPADDGQQCTAEKCSMGVPLHTPLTQGTACSQSGGTKCDGAGVCVACTAAADCPAVANECQTAACFSGNCSVANVFSGTVVSLQTPGDCKKSVCNGSGAIVATNDDTDVPPDDGKQCTIEACSGGVALHTPVTAGTACAAGKCDALGTCVACLSASDCPAGANECQKASCSAGTCGTTNVAAGTTATAQTPGDCKKNVCNGSGAIVASVDDLDLPLDDGKPCTTEACSAGVPQHTPVAVGTTCSAGKCDALGNCAGCISALDCPAAPNECETRSCTAGVCGFDKVASGTVTSAQTSGDCRQNQCDGLGNIISAVFASDLPNDGNQCTQDLCTMGVPSYPPQPTGTSCTQSGGTSCDGSGTCVNLPTVSVTTTSPADATSATAGKTLSITFSTAMNPATLTAQTTAGACTGSLQVSLDDFASCIAFPSAVVMAPGNSLATLTAAPGLLVNRTYKIRVTTAAKSSTGVPLSAQYTHVTGFKTGSPAAVGAGSVVISQVYGGGGNASAPYLNDYVELHNRGNTVASLTGWSIQYAATTGTSWSASNLSGSIRPGGYYLIQLSSGGTAGSALPSADVLGTINMSASAGKVALVSSVAALSGACPSSSTIVDLVGWGAGTSCSETAVAPGPASGNNTLSVLRAASGCTDANDNATDFVVATPTPRNSASTGFNCGFPVYTQNESNAAGEADWCVVQSPTSLAPAAGSAQTVYGRLFETGVTDSAGANASVLAQLGYGSAAANPEYEAGWTWVNASYNASCSGCGTNNDEYQATFNAPATGSYRYVYRFSVDAGATWTVCDLDGAGSNAGLTFDFGQEAPMSVP